ncbi:glycosyl transferase [Chitinophaga eiseniae]|uniref:Glycosyl transferase n=1 Tax=Chitinophaga eiseniae TaxID=634771 RepID=A0A847SR33_9BACT|nr:glycosyl transferase [Chitinophaga eiseniae]
MSFENTSIPTYIINLSERTDRRASIINEFKGKPEFDVKIINAIKHPIGAVGLWRTIQKIIHLAIENEDEIIVICEDDHQFTTQYSKDFLFKNIFEAYSQGADYLSGGSGGIHHPIPISPSRFWGAECLSTQFIIIYKRFFSTILNEEYDESVRADIILSEITSNKAVIFPFISTQKEFGYSDVTDLHNLGSDVVLNLFEKSESKLQRIRLAHNKYCMDE